MMFNYNMQILPIFPLSSYFHMCKGHIFNIKLMKVSIHSACRIRLWLGLVGLGLGLVGLGFASQASRVYLCGMSIHTASLIQLWLGLVGLGLGIGFRVRVCRVRVRV